VGSVQYIGGTDPHTAMKEVGEAPSGGGKSLALSNLAIWGALENEDACQGSEDELDDLSKTQKKNKKTTERGEG